MQRTAFLFICFLICVNCFSQQYPFVHYTPREGLVNNRCRFIYQDSKGKLYIATYGGLSIYDGSRFINYTTSNGLADNLVNDVVEMGEDSVWIIPNVQKIHCLVKGRLKDFIPSDGFSPSINQLVKTSTGIYYAMAEDGLFLLRNKRFIKMSPDRFGDVSIKTLLQGFEFDNKLFILFNPDYKLPSANLLVYDLASNKIIACNKNEGIGGLIRGYGKELWITTPKGLCAPDKIDEQTGTVKLKALTYNWPLPKDIGIYSAFVDKQNNVWMQTSKGLYRIKNNVASLFTTENGLITNYQTFIFQDAENNMWFANDQTGVSKLSNQQLAFYPWSMPGYSASDIFIGSASDSVWMHDIYHHKLIVLLPDGQRKEYESPEESLPSLAKFVSGNKKWFTCGKAIYQLKLHSDNKHYSSNIYFNDSNSKMGYSCALIDKNGNLVAVSDKVVVISKTKILTAPVYNLVDQLTIDEANRIWVVNRSNQLYCFQISDNDNNQLELLRPYFSIVKGSPRSITADHSGNIWIGTRDQGLYCLHFNGLELQSSKQITMQNGLSENFISYLYCDKDNIIWACTPSGLDRIKVANNNFLVENITRSSNLYYPISKIQQTAKGLFWIMSGQGLIRYDPVKPSTGNWKPQLLFSEVLVNNNQTAITNNDKLKHFQNNLVFQLSAPTYIDEKQTRFSYLLEGSGNNEWSHLSPNPSINLVNLPPGNYTLRARAIFLHGLYPNAESSYSFIILPPWWQTAWFKLLMAVVLAGLIFFSVRFYFKRKLQLQMIALEKKQAVEKERTRIATDMHDDLGAGLSKIKFLSETIGMKKQQHLPIEEEITRIRTYSHEMIDKMGEIVWALNEKNDSLEDLLSYTRSYAVEYLQENGIHCKVNEPDVIPDINVSGDFRRNIYLTVKETLHNIVKHAQATEVEINIEIRDRLMIQIQDNGIGIDTTPIHSPGNGLFNMNKRIEGLNGRFKIVNNNGTQININVPLTN